ncbi:MAG: mechanosensitive ion channel [Planctomycetota bacterium]
MAGGGLTFGLAFGLQEIFANFVSGIIILMERPIRVGDVVTVGQTTGTPVSGTVTRVRMRATTVTDWDNKELIIPNKEFVTGQVINWSLSSPEIRLCLPVGIAYGSDTGRAREILLSVARGHPHVLADPEPVAFFDAFGDSALNFELRAFVAHVRHRYTVKHELLDEINRRFNEAGICIAFPQSDVHLHPTQGLRELLQDEAPRRDARAERDAPRARSTPRDERAEPRAPAEPAEPDQPPEPAADASVYSQAAYEATREPPEVAEDAATRNGRAPSEDRTAGARR